MQIKIISAAVRFAVAAATLLGFSAICIGLKKLASIAEVTMSLDVFGFGAVAAGVAAMIMALCAVISVLVKAID